MLWLLVHKSSIGLLLAGLKGPKSGTLIAITQVVGANAHLRNRCQLLWMRFSASGSGTSPESAIQTAATCGRAEDAQYQRRQLIHHVGAIMKTSEDLRA